MALSVGSLDMYTREQIIEEIKRIAASKGEQSLSQKDFELNSMIPMSTVRYYLGTWLQALQEAGLGPVQTTDSMAKSSSDNEDELLMDLIRLNKETGEIPTPALIDARGKYYLRHYLERWKSISEAYLLAQKQDSSQQLSFQPRLESFPSAPLIEPAELFFQQIESPILNTTPHINPKEITQSLKFMTEPLISVAETSIASLETPDDQELTQKPFIFRGLRNGPVNKIGVIHLFAIIHKELGYYIHSFMPGYPDCLGERCTDRPNNHWEPVNIHFEFKSSDFRQNGVSKSMNDIIVCWCHDWQGCPQEVLELATAIKHLPSR